MDKPKVRSKVNSTHPKIELSKKILDHEDDKLFELLRKAQSQRLDDQRGLGTCSVEMPEFLRKEEDGQWQGCPTPEHKRVSSLGDIFDEVPFNPNCYVHDRDKSFGSNKLDHSEIFGSMEKIMCSNESFSKDSIHPSSEKADDYFSMQPLIIDSNKTIILSDIQKEIEKSSSLPKPYYFHPKTSADANNPAPFASPENYSLGNEDLDNTLVSQVDTPKYSSKDLSNIANFTPPTPVNTSQLRHSLGSGFKLVNQTSLEVNKKALKDKSNFFLHTPPSYESLVKAGKISPSLKPRNISKSTVENDIENPFVTFV